MKNNPFTLVWFVAFAFAIIGLVGWVLNIIAIAGSNFSDVTGMLILRVIGVFVAPLGAVLGLFF